MTSTSKPYRRQSSINLVYRTIWIIFVPITLGAVIYTISRINSASTACLFYACLAGFFLIAQIVGFVISQTYYNEQIEEIKFQMLKNEEREWNL